MQVHKRPIQTAFTLIEVLMVVTVITMVAAATITRISGTGPATQLSDTFRSWQHLDRQGRLYAQRHSRAVLFIDSESHELIMTSLDTGEAIAYSAFSHNVTIQIEHLDRDACRSIVFDRSGRTPDYSIDLRTAGTEHRRWSVVGATGQFSTAAMP